MKLSEFAEELLTTLKNGGWYTGNMSIQKDAKGKFKLTWRLHVRERANGYYPKELKRFLEYRGYRVTRVTAKNTPFPRIIRVSPPEIRGPNDFKCWLTFTVEKMNETDR